METEDIKSDEGERANMLYQLSFNYWDDDPSNDDHIILAGYSSEEQLNKGLEKERSIKKMISGKKAL